MNVFEGLLDYFQNIASALEDKGLATTVFPGVAQEGLSRQALLMRFLAGHLPDRCRVLTGGHVFDSCGNVSKSIDLMVASDLALQLKQSDKWFICLEGCVCVISTADVLDNAACKDCLENLASVPLMPEVPAGLEFLYSARPQSSLVKAVFAFEGADAEATLAQVEEFYAANQVPEGGRPKLIIVNNRYGIVRTGEHGAMTTEGVEIPAHAFHVYGCSTSEPRIGGYSLAYLLTEIQSAVACGPLRIDYGAYLDQLPL